MAANWQCDQGITGLRHPRAQPSALGAEDKDLSRTETEITKKSELGSDNAAKPRR